MNILIVPDSFKDCLAASQVANAIERGLLKNNPQHNVRKIAIADGGEGSVEVLMQSCSGELVEVRVDDPLFRNINSSYAVLADSKTAVVEMAKASGLELLNDSERNPLYTTTYGTGELIKDALDIGYRKFICFIGGSATNDGGMGMAQALGVKFYDSSSIELKGIGAELINIKKIVIDDIDSRIAESEFLIACDVTNPLIGMYGATHTYAAQKGAHETVVDLLERGMCNYVKQLSRICNINVSSLEGAGAAGGLGAGMVVFLSGKLKRGVEIIIGELQLEKQFDWADVVIAGEGKIDGQTLNGKAPYEIAKRAKTYGCRTIGVAGVLGEGYEKLLGDVFDELVAIKKDSMSAEYSIVNAKELLSGIDFEKLLKNI
ncbi:MAG: glycerate kinase [Rikenellaceae bacterium]